MINPIAVGSNNTNKLSPQERALLIYYLTNVQIIQINLVLKNVKLPNFHLKMFK